MADIDAVEVYERAVSGDDDDRDVDVNVLIRNPVEVGFDRNSGALEYETAGLILFNSIRVTDHIEAVH
ncbi:hypothetical protein C5D36_04700 [Rathayibacter sp. AY1C6]|nr:hypothetical protein C5D36_04700 [Rathayibacter sp. AY1C6]